MMHELAHIMTNNWGHILFWNNFKFLVDNAVEFKLYKYIDYNTNQLNIVVFINSNP